MLKSKIKLVICWILALFFFAAGVLLHFMTASKVANIVPPFLPYPRLIVIVTGVMEVLFSIGLVWPKWRRFTGIILSVYLLAVLPANIYMALESMPLGDRELTAFQLWFRVALQFPLIALILWASGYWEKPKTFRAG